MAWLGAAESDEVPGPNSQLYFDTLRKGLFLNRIDHLQRRPQRFHEVSRGDALVVEGANPSWHDQCPRFFPMPFGEKDTFRSQDQIHFAPCRVTFQIGERQQGAVGEPDTFWLNMPFQKIGVS